MLQTVGVSRLQIFPENLAGSGLGDGCHELHPAGQLLVAGELLGHGARDGILRQTLVSPDHVGTGHLTTPLVRDSCTKNSKR